VSGVVRYRGQEILSETARTRARSVAYVPPDIRADFPLTAQEAVLLGRIPQSTALVRQATPEDRSAVQAAMERCFCWGLRHRDLHTLSGGERQLVTLARALAQGARVLLLDEALSRMDLNHQAAMGVRLRELASEGYAIVLVAHDFNLGCEWADSALLLKDGKKIGLGPVREVLTTEKLKELYPGANLILAASPVSGVPKVYFGN
jgi:iron complex transport system ATP-binding protein